VRRAAAAAVVAGLLALTAGCTSGSSIGSQANSDGKVSTGTVEQVAAVDRKAALTVSGTTLAGAALSTASWRGQVVVLNYWGSWCGPCQDETPALRSAWTELKGQGVQFLGLDSQEQPPTGAAYMSSNGLGYPSLAWDGGKFLLQLKGKAPAPPVTIVLDQKGRLAARVVGEVDATTLVGLVHDVLAGSAT
jgi:thiol-disulfide isomerase/thioredoxin